jgi:polyketide cyclase/dehydrase/lipid transport protein
MKWILVTALTIASIVALAALIGSRLPRSHQASREQTLAASPEAIWTAITDVEAFPSWRKDIKNAHRLPDRDGRAVWVEEGSSGRMTLVVERMEAPRLLVVRIADPDLPFGGTWTYEITPAAGGARLIITEDGEVYNPLFRFMARFIFGYEGTIASYVAALEKRFARE